MECETCKHVEVEALDLPCGACRTTYHPHKGYTHSGYEAKEEESETDD